MILMKKILMKKIKYRFFFRKYNEVSKFASSLLKYQKFFKLGTQKFHLPEYKKCKKFFGGFLFPEVNFFIFQFLVFGNIRKAIF